jgi:hypothetical protein
VEVSVKTGVEASANAGFSDNTISASVEYFEGTEAHATVNASVTSDLAGISATGDAYVKAGTEVSANLEVGQHGVAAGAGVSIGNATGVDGEGTVSAGGISTTAGAGVSIGEHLEAGGSAEATFKDGKATVGVSGDVAALVGVDVDVKVSVDTKEVVKDANTVANKTVEVSKDVAHVVTDTAPKVEKAANTFVDQTKKAASSAGKAIKKIFRF